MAHWLLKTEPAEYSIDDLRSEARGYGVWDGIRNFQARNLLRDRVCPGDSVLIYHSQCRQPGVAGRAEVVRAAYPDPTQFDPDSHYFDPRASGDQPRWYCIDVAFCEAFPRPVSLAEIKREQALQDMVLLRQGRLSVQPVQPKEWTHILSLAARSRDNRH